MQQTSLSSYWSLSKQQINQRQKQVLEALEEIAPANNRRVSEYSKIPINVVTPRMGELVKKQLVKIAYIGKDISGRQTIYWKPAKSKDEYGDSE